jgi:hypothetical protein
MLEVEIENYVKDNWANKFKHMKLIGFQIEVMGSVSREPIGRVDFAFYKSGIKHFCEIKKESDGHYAIWDSMKILAYCESQSLYECSRVKPVVMVHRNNLRYDFMPVLFSLGCGTITYDDQLIFSINLI